MFMIPLAFNTAAAVAYTSCCVVMEIKCPEVGWRIDTLSLHRVIDRFPPAATKDHTTNQPTPCSPFT
jgi:hypothetical protein